MATKGEIIDTVMLDVGDRPTDAAVRALYRTWFDDALDMILARWPWFYRREVDTIDVTASGFASFAFPASVAEVKALRIQDVPRTLTYVDHDQLMNMDADLTQTGQPSMWYYLGYDADDETQLAGLYPRPSEDLTLEYDAVMQTPLPLGENESVPLPREARSILGEGIRGYSYENEGQAELAASSWARFQYRLEKLAFTRGISRPERRSRLKEDGDLAHVRNRAVASRFSPIPSS